MLNGNVIKKEVGTLLMNIRTIPKYLILIIAFPQLVLWLPEYIYGK